MSRPTSYVNVKRLGLEVKFRVHVMKFRTHILTMHFRCIAII